MENALKNLPVRDQIKFLLDRDKLDLALPLMEDEGTVLLLLLILIRFACLFDVVKYSYSCHSIRDCSNRAD